MKEVENGPCLVIDCPLNWIPVISSSNLGSKIKCKRSACSFNYPESFFTVTQIHTHPRGWLGFNIIRSHCKLLEITCRKLNANEKRPFL